MKRNQSNISRFGHHKWLPTYLGLGTPSSVFFKNVHKFTQ